MARARVHFNDDATELWDVESGRARESLIELIDRVEFVGLLIDQRYFVM